MKEKTIIIIVTLAIVISLLAVGIISILSTDTTTIEKVIGIVIMILMGSGLTGLFFYYISD